MSSLDHRKALNGIKLQKFKLCLEQTFLIFWGEWLIVSELVTQLNKQMNNLGRRRGEKGLSGHTGWKYATPWSGDSVLGPPSCSRTCGWCLWPTVSSVVFGNTWCSIHFPDSAGSTILYCQSRPSCPREPQPTPARMKEMALISFHFSHIKWGRRTRSVRWSWPSCINKLMPQHVCVCMRICISVSFKMCVLDTI